MNARILAVLAALPVLLPAVLPAQSPGQGGPGQGGPVQAPFRPPVTFEQEPKAPPIPADVTDDRRVARNYPEQPPVIPHNIRDYQVTLNNNQCLTCHSRQYTAGSQAPMISITHFVDRDGQTLGGVTPRRYFCLQCHVPQTVAQPIVRNDFRDVDSLLSRPSDGGDRR